MGIEVLLDSKHEKFVLPETCELETAKVRKKIIENDFSSNSQTQTSLKVWRIKPIIL
jgi:hypothetical protein